jgi:Spy/CpxP family protein refolding chaperone
MKASMAVRLGLAIAGVLIAGAMAGAQAPGNGQRMGAGFGYHQPPVERAFGAQGAQGRWWNNPKVAEELKLTDAQRKSMDDILLQHRESLVDLRGSLEKAEMALEPLMRDDQPNEGKILSQIDKVAQARAELEKANARFLLALRGKLTPEQWKQLQADRANRGNRVQQRGTWGQGAQSQGRGAQRQRQYGQGGGQGMRQTPPPQPVPAPQSAGPQ